MHLRIKYVLLQVSGAVLEIYCVCCTNNSVSYLQLYTLHLCLLVVYAMHVYTRHGNLPCQHML